MADRAQQLLDYALGEMSSEAAQRFAASLTPEEQAEVAAIQGLGRELQSGYAKEAMTGLAPEQLANLHAQTIGKQAATRKQPGRKRWAWGLGLLAGPALAMVLYIQYSERVAPYQDQVFNLTPAAEQAVKKESADDQLAEAKGDVSLDDSIMAEAESMPADTEVAADGATASSSLARNEGRVAARPRPAPAPAPAAKPQASRSAGQSYAGGGGQPSGQLRGQGRSQTAPQANKPASPAKNSYDHDQKTLGLGIGSQEKARQQPMEIAKRTPSENKGVQFKSGRGAQEGGPKLAREQKRQRTSTGASLRNLGVSAADQKPGGLRANTKSSHSSKSRFGLGGVQEEAPARAKKRKKMRDDPIAGWNFSATTLQGSADSNQIGQQLTARRQGFDLCVDREAGRSGIRHARLRVQWQINAYQEVSGVEVDAVSGQPSEDMINCIRRWLTRVEWRRDQAQQTYRLNANFIED